MQQGRTSRAGDFEHPTLPFILKIKIRSLPASLVFIHQIVKPNKGALRLTYILRDDNVLAWTSIVVYSFGGKLYSANLALQKNKHLPSGKFNISMENHHV